MAYDEAGAGDPVLLLHAGVADRRVWQPQWSLLAERFRVIRCDLRGFGETPLPPERFSHAEDVAELLDQLGIETTAIVGSSYGGRVALEVAATHPERVTRLVLLCPGFRGLEPTANADAFEHREEALAEAGDIDGLVELSVATWLGPDADESARDLLRQMKRHAEEVQLAAWAGPAQPRPRTRRRRPGADRLPGRRRVGRQGHGPLSGDRRPPSHLDAQVAPRRAGLGRPPPGLERPDETTALIIDALTAPQ